MRTCNVCSLSTQSAQAKSLYPIEGDELKKDEMSDPQYVIRRVDELLGSLKVHFDSTFGIDSIRRDFWI